MGVRKYLGGVVSAAQESTRKPWRPQPVLLCLSSGPHQNHACGETREGPPGSADRTRDREAGGPGAGPGPGTKLARREHLLLGACAEPGSAPPPVMLGFCAEAEQARGSVGGQQEAPLTPMLEARQGLGGESPWGFLLGS